MRPTVVCSFHRYVFAIILVSLCCGTSANAVPILTAEGAAAGFSLSQFASNFPNNGAVGPLGIAFPGGTSVMVSDYPGNVRVFPTHADGQNAGSVPVAQNYGFANAVGLATAGGQVYMTQQSAGTVVQLNSNGTFNQTIVTGLPTATGIAANPSTGRLYVSDCCSGGGRIWDVDPIAKTFTVFKALGGGADGLTVSPDGSVLYAEANGRILGFRTDTGVQIFDSGLFSDGPDGTELGFGSLAGQLFVLTNGGNVWEVDLTTLARTQLVTGGTRGDFVTADPNGSLLLTFTSDIWRLSAPAGGCIGAGCGGTVPEPSSVALLAAALGALGLSRRRRTS